jgi:prepilin-type processing-associated H-X9-DG protein
MKTNSPAPEDHAFTRFELAVVLAVMALLTLILLPALAQVGGDAKRMQCVNNLKFAGLELVRWAGSHGDVFPMAVPSEKGGTKELVEGGNAFRHFQVIGSNDRPEEPKILICPADTRRAAKRFDELQNVNLSYFVGLDVKDRESRSQMFLSGDRNITNGLAPVKSILKLPPTRPTGWNETMHNGQGNVFLADGSVQRFTGESLRKSLKFTGDATNRIALP